MLPKRSNSERKLCKGNTEIGGAARFLYFFISLFLYFFISMFHKLFITFALILFVASPAVAAPATTEECVALHGSQAYYDSGCRCKEGFYMNTRTNTCEEKPTMYSCVREFGENARYNNFTNVCECKLNYHFDRTSHRCVSDNVLCQRIYGEYSYLNFVNNRCYCSDDHILDGGGKCVKRPTTTVMTDTFVTSNVVIDLNAPVNDQIIVPTASKIIFTKLLQLGSRGDEVARLQEILVARGYLAATAPRGYFGALTKRAVQLFQKEFGILQTGAVGELTKSALNKL